MFAELLSIVAPVYVCALLGFGWSRAGRGLDAKEVVDLVTWIGAPCLVFSSLVGLDVDPAALAEIALACVCLTVGLAVAGVATTRLLGLSTTTYLAPLTFGNAGNMGMPICLFAFGEQGLALAACFFATTTLIHFTVGQWLWRGAASFRQLLATPLAYSVVLAALVIGFELELPRWIINSTELLGSFTLPLMVFMLGMTLAKIHPARIGRSLGLSVLRLGLGLGLGLLVVRLLELEGTVRDVLLVNCAMPAAVINYLFAQKFQREPEEVASLVVVSTLVAFASIPWVLGWILGAG